MPTRAICRESGKMFLSSHVLPLTCFFLKVARGGGERKPGAGGNGSRVSEPLTRAICSRRSRRQRATPIEMAAAATAAAATAAAAVATADKNGLALHMQIRADMMGHYGSAAGCGGGIPYWMERATTEPTCTARRSDQVRRSLAEYRMHTESARGGERGREREGGREPSGDLPDSIRQSAHAEFPTRSCAASVHSTQSVASCPCCGHIEEGGVGWRRRQMMRAAVEAVTVDLISLRSFCGRRK